MEKLRTVDDVVKSKTEYETDLTNYAQRLRERSNKEFNEQFATLRAFDTKTVAEADIFYIGDMTEMLLPDYFDRVESLGVISETNKKPIFRNRWVMPIKNPAGLVQNFVGYSPSADERYIYGTSKYYRRRDTYYGLENLQLAYDMGYAFITEGITDTIRLRDLGYKNSFAMCGTNTSDYMLRQLNRCRNGVILIPDRDDAGIRAHRNWLFNRSITIFINFMYKDVDEMCSIRTEDGNKVKNLENIEWLNECIGQCVDWIKSDEHRGTQCSNEKITII